MLCFEEKKTNAGSSLLITLLFLVLIPLNIYSGGETLHAVLRT